MLRLLVRVLAAGVILNEIRGFVLAAPVLWAMAQVNTLMAVWAGVSALGGIALSVIIPTIVLRRLRRR